MNNPPKIAYLGLGIMGSAMAANLQKKGYSVNGWNRTAGRPHVEELAKIGVLLKSSIEDAVADADLIVTCLGDVADVEQVLLGAVRSAARKGCVVVDMTTIGRDAAVKIAAELGKSGLPFLDAPVTGGDIGAKNGTLTIMVGGDKSTFDETLPVLETVGKTIVWCGEAGSGQALKLCNQILCAVNLVAVSEALTLAQGLGIDASLVVEVLAGGAGGSWSLSNLGPRILKGDFAPGFPIEHMLKDLRLVHENAEHLDLPGVELSERLFKQSSAENKGDSRLGTQAMFQAYDQAKQGEKK
jgi:3-hydroxyisobutyrate dehydrogenase